MPMHGNKKKKAMAKGGYGTPTRKMNMSKPKLKGGGMGTMKKKKGMARGGKVGAARRK